MYVFRLVLAVLLGLFAILMLVTALTVPAFAATAPAILAIALVAATWFVFPKRKHRRTLDT